MSRPHIFSFALPKHEITEDLSEQVADDNPMAVEVAKPLFDAGINFSAITERPEFLRRKTGHNPWHVYYLVIQGELHIEAGGENIRLQAGDLAFCPAKFDFKRTALPGKPVHLLYIWLDDTPAWEPLKRHGFYWRHYESADLMFLLLRRILDAHRYRNVQQIALAHSHANALVDLLRHELLMIGRPPQPYTALLQQLMTDIQNAPGSDWSAATMAKRLNVSERKLYRIFDSEYGMPPKEMIIRQRISNAAQQLAQTSTSIGKIADTIGYESIYSFSNLFKKHTGLRPSAYRKRFR